MTGRPISRRSLEERRHKCPTCGAEPGHACRRPQGVSRTHAARLELAGLEPLPPGWHPDKEPISDYGPSIRAVPCPTCGAGSGQRCRTAGGVLYNTYHVPRKDAS